VAVDVAPVVTADFDEAVDVVGALAPKFTADVKSEVTGTVSAVHVTEWVAVAKGAPLADLDTTETLAAIDALRAAEAQARVGESRARREHARALQLREYGLITPQALDEAASALEAAAAAVTAAQAQVRTAQARLAKSSIHAPISGVVSLRRVNVGDRVENMGGNEPMFRIVDTRLLELTVPVPSSQLPRVAVGAPVEFTIDAWPGRTFTGRVSFINPTVDDASRSARVVVEVANADGLLKGGLFARGRIVTGKRSAVLQVPRVAVLNWNVGNHSGDVFVVADGRASKRAVQTGTASDDAIEITAGLAAGDTVVTRGGFALRPGDRIQVAAPNPGE
jgi:RND family efflux transporter MFP subunit